MSMKRLKSKGSCPYCRRHEVVDYVCPICVRPADDRVAEMLENDYIMNYSYFNVRKKYKAFKICHILIRLMSIPCLMAIMYMWYSVDNEYNTKWLVLSVIVEVMYIIFLLLYKGILSEPMRDYFDSFYRFVPQMKKEQERLESERVNAIRKRRFEMLRKAIDMKIAE